jgi:hypothetical protein
MSTSEQSHMRTGSQSPRAMERITIALDGACSSGLWKRFGRRALCVACKFFLAGCRRAEATPFFGRLARP